MGRPPVFRHTPPGLRGVALAKAYLAELRRRGNASWGDPDVPGDLLGLEGAEFLFNGLDGYKRKIQYISVQAAPVEVTMAAISFASGLAHRPPVGICLDLDLDDVDRLVEAVNSSRLREVTFYCSTGGDRAVYRVLDQLCAPELQVLNVPSTALSEGGAAVLEYLASPRSCALRSFELLDGGDFSRSALLKVALEAERVNFTLERFETSELLDSPEPAIKEWGRRNQYLADAVIDTSLMAVAPLRVLQLALPSAATASVGWHSLPTELTDRILAFCFPALSRKQLTRLMSFAADRKTLGKKRASRDPHYRQLEWDSREGRRPARMVSWLEKHECCRWDQGASAVGLDEKLLRPCIPTPSTDARRLRGKRPRKKGRN